MTSGNPKGLAIIISLIATVVVSILLIVQLYVEDIWQNWPFLLLVIPLGFITIFASTYYLIQLFLQRKISMIYRTIHELKTARSESEKIDMDSDVLGDINIEAQEWAQEKKEEIKELEDREQYRREFIGNLSHELKTPLFNIEGYILTLLEGGLEDKNVNREFLERASKGVERLGRIVEDMDMITKLESGIMDMKIERIDLMKVIAEVLVAVEMSAKKGGMRVEVNKPLGRPVMVMVDKNRLIQLFINLLNNSIRYGSKGGLVKIDILELEGQLWVEVEDDGIGISSEHLPRLFERFYRIGSSRSRNEGGSGLGLAIVKHIVDAHGQTIAVSSKEGKGTIFTFTLQKAS